jgi:Arc/MetJ family transcription regulator
MRTNIVIDDELMEAAMKAGGFKTKRDAVEEGLRLLARRAAYQNIRALRGKLKWSLEGDWTAPGAVHTVQQQQAGYAPQAASRASRAKRATK